jgi:hypothetical protein
MNLNPLLETLLSHLKDALFSPKDQFERAKRSATRTLITPLILILGGESALVAILGAVSSVEFRSGEVFFKLAGAASDSFLALSGVVLLTFFSIVGTNLYYSHHIKTSRSEIERLAKETRLAAAYERLRTRFDELIAARRTEEAYYVAGFMLNRYPDYVNQDPDMMASLVSDGNLATVRQLQILIPERQALPEGVKGTAEATSNTVSRADG